MEDLHQSHIESTSQHLLRIEDRQEVSIEHRQIDEDQSSWSYPS